MPKEKFGVAVAEELAEEVDEIVAECDDLDASRSEVIEAILTAFTESEIDQIRKVRELVIRRRKGTL